MKQNKSEQALNAYLNFWRLEEQRKLKAQQKRRQRIVLSWSSAAAVLIIAATFSLNLLLQEDQYVVYLHGKKVVDKEFALQQMNSIMSDFPVAEQSVGEQLSTMFEVLTIDE